MPLNFALSTCQCGELECGRCHQNKLGKQTFSLLSQSGPIPIKGPRGVKRGSLHVLIRRAGGGNSLEVPLELRRMGSYPPGYKATLGGL